MRQCFGLVAINLSDCGQNQELSGPKGVCRIYVSGHFLKEYHF